MRAVVYNGEHTVLMTPREIGMEITIEETIRLYQTTWIYRSAIREVLSDSDSNDLQMLAHSKEVETGVGLLYERLVADLGEETALQITARTSMDLLLATA